MLCNIAEGHSKFIQAFLWLAVGCGRARRGHFCRLVGSKPRRGSDAPVVERCLAVCAPSTGTFVGPSNSNVTAANSHNRTFVASLRKVEGRKVRHSRRRQREPCRQAPRRRLGDRRSHKMNVSRVRLWAGWDRARQAIQPILMVVLVMQTWWGQHVCAFAVCCSTRIVEHCSWPRSTTTHPSPAAPATYVSRRMDTRVVFSTRPLAIACLRYSIAELRFCTRQEQVYGGRY